MIAQPTETARLRVSPFVSVINAGRMINATPARANPVSIKPGAVSRGDRNNAGERFGWCVPTERLSRATVQPEGYGVELRLRTARERRAFWKVLPQQPIGVFARRTLPRASRIAEVHLQTRGDGETRMRSHFLALIPRQGAAEMSGQCPDRLRQGPLHVLRESAVGKCTSIT